MVDDPKARTLANGIDVWCSFGTDEAVIIR